MKPISLVPELKLQDLSHLLDKVFLVFPNYCLGMSFSQFYQNYERITFCKSNPVTKAICNFYSEYLPLIDECHSVSVS